jgi:adenosylcobinamide kinase/adenosylcobinamide-phosphate guanylyltransferase
VRLKYEVDLKLEQQPDCFEGACVLLEDIPNLVANEMFGTGRKGETDTDMNRRLFEEIKYLSQISTHMIIVTGNLFTGGCEHDNMTTDYLKSLAGLNNRLAALCDEVYEVVCGIPVILKSEKTH